MVRKKRRNPQTQSSLVQQNMYTLKHEFVVGQQMPLPIDLAPSTGLLPCTHRRTSGSRHFRSVCCALCVVPLHSFIPFQMYTVIEKKMSIHLR